MDLDDDIKKALDDWRTTTTTTTTQPAKRPRAAAKAKAKAKANAAANAAANAKLTAFLQAECQSDLTAAQSQLTYDYFKSELAEQKKARDEMSKAVPSIVSGSKQ